MPTFHTFKNLLHSHGLGSTAKIRAVYRRATSPVNLRQVELQPWFPHTHEVIWASNLDLYQEITVDLSQREGFKVPNYI